MTTSQFVESFPADLTTTLEFDKVVLTPGLSASSALDASFRTSYGVHPRHAQAGLRLRLEARTRSPPSNLNDGRESSTKLIGQYMDVLAQAIPLRRWTEVFASEHPSALSTLPPVAGSAGSAEFARVFVWACVTVRARDEEPVSSDAENSSGWLDFNHKALINDMMAILFDLRRFPLRARGAASVAVLLEEVNKANTRKVADLRLALECDRNPLLSASTRLRIKEKMAWWAVHASKRWQKELRRQWLRLGKPVDEEKGQEEETDY